MVKEPSIVAKSAFGQADEFLLVGVGMWLAKSVREGIGRGLAGLALLVGPFLLVSLAMADQLSWPLAVGGALLTAAPGVALLIYVSIARRRQAEQLASLRRTQAKLEEDLEALAKGRRQILASLPDPLLAITRQQTIADANPAAQELFADDVRGRPLTAVLRDPDINNAVTAVLGENGHRTVSFRVPGKVEQHFRANVVSLPVPAPDGTAVLVMLHDVTAARQADRMRSDFIANASHELRTPLASLSGFIETLQGVARDDTEAQPRFLAIMSEQADRMRHLIEDLLSLSRIELLEHTLPRGTTDIRQLLQAVADSLTPLAQEMSIRFRIEAENLPLVAGDLDELEQVFQNLMSNAIKYGRVNTEIRVIARSEPEGSPGARRLGRPGVKISVHDEGEGIAAEHLPRLTERFYRVSKDRSRQLGGTGLGLAIVKHIVNRHRGVLEIESQVGVGSTFSVFLPAVQAGQNSLDLPLEDQTTAA